MSHVATTTERDSSSSSHSQLHHPIEAFSNSNAARIIALVGIIISPGASFLASGRREAKPSFAIPCSKPQSRHQTRIAQYIPTAAFRLY